jgi:regulator of extracellular matrix RemA (YlzA/DUF370 family)
MLFLVGDVKINKNWQERKMLTKSCYGRNKKKISITNENNIIRMIFFDMALILNEYLLRQELWNVIKRKFSTNK